MNPATIPVITWLAYAIPSYLLYPLVFRAVYGRSAVVERFPPRNLYDVFDLYLGVGLFAYSVWIVFGAADPARALSLWGGVAAWGAGYLLRAWAVRALGPNWRIGQDPEETHAAFVATGPYRFLRHPINTALVLVAIGQALMTGVDWRAMFLLVLALTYLFAQAGAEKRHWTRKREVNGDE